MRVQDYIVRVLELKPELTTRQLTDAIRRDCKRKFQLSSVRTALDQMRLWNVIDRRREANGYVHWLRFDYRVWLERQEKVRTANIAGALEKNRQRSRARGREAGEDKPRITERKPRERSPIVQTGEPARLQRLFDSLVMGVRNRAGS